MILRYTGEIASTSTIMGIYYFMVKSPVISLKPALIAYFIPGYYGCSDTEY
ncbi:MAG TPA: hypothetical protein VKR53_13650 [Puia sp.]|nr:hypothetical protein [Puia sp.]